jgi:hypothetical protein
MSIPRHSKGTLCGMKTYVIFFHFLAWYLIGITWKKWMNILKNEMSTREGEIIFCFWEQNYEHFIFWSFNVIKCNLKLKEPWTFIVHWHNCKLCLLIKKNNILIDGNILVQMAPSHFPWSLQLYLSKLHFFSKHNFSLII